MTEILFSSCSATFGQVVSAAAIDVLGEADAAGLVAGAEHNFDIGVCIAALQARYGQGGCKGIAQRMGQAAFKHFLDSYGSDLNLTNLEYHLLPSVKRLRSGLEKVSRKLGEECGTRIQLDADDNAYYWRITAQSTSDCECLQNGFANFLAGMAQELLSWSGGGRFYDVRQVLDANACVLRMDQRPLD